MTKLAFFDIDGVLSIPRYMKDGRLVPGGSDDWWQEYCETQEHPYQDCGVPDVVLAYLKNLQENGCELFVLSQESFEAGEEAKRDFIKMRYSEFFDDNHIILVRSNPDKLTYMLNLSCDRDIPREEIEFWDDTFKNVLDASIASIDAHHISEILALDFTADC